MEFLKALLTILLPATNLWTVLLFTQDMIKGFEFKPISTYILCLNFVVFVYGISNVVVNAIPN